MKDLPASPVSKKTHAATPFRLYLKAPGEKRRPPRGVDALVNLDNLGEAGVCLHTNLQKLWPLPEGKQKPVQAFLLFALAVWAADKLLPRSPQPDAWTRNLQVEIPTTPDWAALAPRLAFLLKFLTGDTWTVQPRDFQEDLPFAGNWPHAW